MRILDFADGFESAVEPTSIDFPASNVTVTPTGNLSSDNAQDAFEELQTDIDDLDANKLDASLKGAAGGLAELDGSGKIPTAQIPALALVDVSVVADNTARDALTVQEGDVAFVTATGKSYVWDGSSWVLLNTDTAVNTHSALTTGVHGVTGDVLGTSDTQVVTNKDIDGGTAANNRRITIPKNTKANLDALTRKEGTIVYATDTGKFYRDNGTVLQAVGTGSGGSLNYISDGDAEGSTIGNLYTDAADTKPADGTSIGNTATGLTLAQSSSSPIRDTKSWTLAKAGSSNYQGQGWAIPFTHPGIVEVCDIIFEYNVSSGTYTDDAVRVYIVDVTTGAVIEPSNCKIKNVGLTSKHRSCTFQTTKDSTSYRLCFHVAGTDTTAFTLKIDSISVGPQATSSVFFGSEPKAYTPSLTSSGGGAITLNSTSKTDPNGFYWQEGKFLCGEVTFRNGSGGAASGSAGTVQISIPTGLTMDTAAMPTAVGGVRVNGDADVGTTTFTSANIYANSTTTLAIMATGGSSYVTVANLAASYYVSMRFKVPIVGWSANAVIAGADAGDSRVVALRATLTGSQSGVTDKVIPWNNATVDTHGALNTTTGVWTCHVPGIYRVYARTLLYSVDSSNNSFILVRKNTIEYGRSFASAIISSANTHLVQIYEVVQLAAGDTIDIYADGDASFDIDVNAGRNAFIIEKLGGNSAVASSDTVAFRATTAAGANIVTGNTIVYGTLEDSSHGSAIFDVATGIFTAPSPGRYKFTGMFYTGAATASGLSTAVGLSLSIDGGAATKYLCIFPSQTTSSSLKSANGSVTLRLLGGQTVKVVGYNDTGSTHAMVANGNVNFFEGARIGNY